MGAGRGQTPRGDHADMDHAVLDKPLSRHGVAPSGELSHLAGYFVGSLFVGHASRSAELASRLAARRKAERS